MSKHTPGPWEAFTQESFAGWWSVEDENCDEIGSGDGGFDEADARLIAAAPELLEALEPFAHIEIDSALEIVPNGYSDPQEWRNHVLAARAAIAKAKGESA